jgi:hypothetical protein
MLPWCVPEPVRLIFGAARHIQKNTTIARAVRGGTNHGCGNDRTYEISFCICLRALSRTLRAQLNDPP